MYTEQLGILGEAIGQMCPLPYLANVTQDPPPAPLFANRLKQVENYHLAVLFIFLLNVPFAGVHPIGAQLHAQV